MKKIYWRPRAVSRTALVLIALGSLVGLFVVELGKREQDRPYFEEKMAAAQKAQEAFEAIKAERNTLGPPIDPEVDPSESGIIGLPMSAVTSVKGVLAAKQTAANPNFAAAVVDMLKEAGVQEGDVVALGCSGSFPSLNSCAYAACETLKLEPIVICSASASEWGANVPDLMWIDMERILNKAGVFQTLSIAASVGGDDDMGRGLTEEGVKIVTEAITQRNQLPLIRLSDEQIETLSPTERFDAIVADRLSRYRKAAGGKPIKAYINIGGGAISSGRAIGKQMFRAGLNTRPPGRLQQLDGVMPQLIDEGIPCLHLVHVTDLAARYQLPIQPQEAPSVGEGGVFRGIDYYRPLVIGVLVTVLAMLYGFIRSDIGFRLLRGAARKKREGHPEPMV